MKITIDTKWIECLEDFDTETKVALYEAIFDYMSDKKDVRLPDDTWKMFAILRPMLDEEKNKRLRLSERSRENGKKGGRKPIAKNQQEPKKPNRFNVICFISINYQILCLYKYYYGNKNRTNPYQ
jgi:hypothetical protein